MKGPYAIVQMKRLSLNDIDAAIVESNIPTLSEGMKVLTRAHQNDPWYQYLLINGDGIAIRWRYKNGPASYKTKTINGEPYYQKFVDAATA